MGKEKDKKDEENIRLRKRRAGKEIIEKEMKEANHTMRHYNRKTDK